MSLHRRSAAALAALLQLSVMLLLGTSPPSTAAAGTPIVARVSKDASTSLYTIAIKHAGAPAPLLLDLSGPLLWLADCPSPHRIISCSSAACKVANIYRPPSCPRTACRVRTACTAQPYNPVERRCASGDVTTITLAANATDGRRELAPVSFLAHVSCTLGELMASLPAGAAGVAGLSRLPLALPSQVANKLSVDKQFALCLPGGSDGGVAIFGGGPFQLLSSLPVELADGLRKSPLSLLEHPTNGAYYFRVTGIAVNQQRVPMPPGAFDFDAGSGTGGAVFSTVTPYTALRPDIYGPLHDAFDEATSGIPRADPVAPFHLCYPASALGTTRQGYDVAGIDLMLDGGRNWTLHGGSSLVLVNDQTACFAFVPMATSMPAAADSPAVIVGGSRWGTA